MQILGLLGMYFDAVVVEVKTFFTFIQIGSDHTVHAQSMAIRFVEFLNGVKLERFLPKNQHTKRKFWNFENWTNGEPQ